ncbi:hypothetical protein [Streptomyces goshikiensis]|uniref:hypothetical protein n=1 Tax=Streptomyces goshikiensis TaxID=1942 RepID=UPI0027E3EC0A|nr:hypothetical protein [Streptomyces goshikiensis]
MPLGNAAAGEPLGELREEAGAGRRVRLVHPDRVPLELLGLHPQPGAGAGGQLGLVGEQPGGLRELTRVGHRLGEPVRDRLPQLLVRLGFLQRGPELVDGGRGIVQQVGGAELEEHLGPVLRVRRLAQRAGQVAARRVGSARGEAVPRRLPQLLHHPGVALGVHLQQVARGGCGAEPVVDQGLGGHAVHGDADARRDRPVHGRGDERVEELHDLLAAQAGEDGQDARVTQLRDRVGRLRLPEGRDASDDADRDGGAQYRGGPGEPDGGGPQLFEAVDQAAALDGGGQVAQLGDAVLVRLQTAVAALHGEFDDLEGVAAGDRPALAAEDVVGVVAKGVAHDARHGARGERSQFVRSRPLALYQGAQ